MKIINLYSIFLACLIGCFYISADAQISNERIKQYVLEYKIPDPILTKQIKEYYSYLNYRTSWIQNENLADRETLFILFSRSEHFGLRNTDYQTDQINLLKRGAALLVTDTDSIQAEVEMTRYAILYFTDLLQGNITPAFRYNGLILPQICLDLPKWLSNCIINKNFAAEKQLFPFDKLPEIYLLEKKIQAFQKIASNSTFSEVQITSVKSPGKNKALLLKLYQFGIIAGPETEISDSLVKTKIREAQHIFQLPEDGILNNSLVKELNVHLTIRLKALILSVNYYRWLACKFLLTSQSVIVVNIPAACMHVYKGNNVILRMKLILGKKSTPTPTLCSRVNNVILYPYWHVPYSIATKEILPALKRNRNYINTGNYQILNNSGKILNPNTINWFAYNANYFPFTIRQSTGCDNALGLLKLDFDNPFGVYLHDTPSKNLFSSNSRYYSHGCMRMEKPMKLGHLVLKNNEIAIDTLEQLGCLRNKAPITVRADDTMPVIVWYSPSGIDSTGNVLFFRDVYGKFSKIQNH